MNIIGGREWYRLGMGNVYPLKRRQNSFENVQRTCFPASSVPKDRMWGLRDALVQRWQMATAHRPTPSSQPRATWNSVSGRFPVIRGPEGKSLCWVMGLGVWYWQPRCRAFAPPALAPGLVQSLSITDEAHGPEAGPALASHRMAQQRQSLGRVAPGLPPRSDRTSTFYHPAAFLPG